MQKKYKGLLIFSKVNNDNNLLVKILTDTDEVISGIVYGGLSNKKRNIYQLGFFLNVNITFKLNKPPSINAELTQPFISSIINDKYKLNCLLSSISLINLSIIEGQKVNNIYQLSNNFLNLMISEKRWINYYFCYLFDLLKIIGYQIDYDNKNNYKFFNLDTLEFNEINTISCVLFPYEVFGKIDKYKLNYDLLKNFFIIFEKVYYKNHLSDLNLHLPNHYQLFKNQILEIFKLK